MHIKREARQVTAAQQREAVAISAAAAGTRPFMKRRVSF